MNSSYMTDPIIFVIDTVCSLYILAIMLRFLLQWSRAEFYNPIAQFLVKITHPPLKILRRYIPPAGKIDTSCIVLMLVLQMLVDFIIRALHGTSVSIGALATLSVAELFSILINVFIFSVFARAILSWLNPGHYNAAEPILRNLTEPLLDLCRKFVPDFGGIDISPLAALILLQLAKMVILPPLYQLASLIS